MIHDNIASIYSKNRKIVLDFKKGIYPVDSLDGIEKIEKISSSILLCKMKENAAIITTTDIIDCCDAKVIAPNTYILDIYSESTEKNISLYCGNQKLHESNEAIDYKYIDENCFFAVIHKVNKLIPVINGEEKDVVDIYGAKDIISNYKIYK